MARINGNNVLTVVRTAYLDLDTVYPIGAIYMSANSASPASLFGGTWQQLQDTFILAAGSNYAAGTTGGEATHQLTTNEMPSHSHLQMGEEGNTIRTLTSPFGNTEGSYYGPRLNFSSSIQDKAISTFVAGGGQAHNNMPPYTAVYVWKRTA